ncbi:MAG: hypothetical protein HYY06_11545 [Deltaproteobacteria bacterium]|nr:hypothetical protein [Deltaproteobacteria bacterium]
MRFWHEFVEPGRSRLGVRPVGVEGKDLEQIMLGMDDELWKTIEARRQEPELISHDEVRSLGIGRRRRR